MTTLIVILVILAIAYLVYHVFQQTDRGCVNGSGDLPVSTIRNNLDFAEDMHKWDVRPPITEETLSFDIDPEFAAKIKRGIKR